MLARLCDRCRKPIQEESGLELSLHLTNPAKSDETGEAEEVLWAEMDVCDTCAPVVMGIFTSRVLTTLTPQEVKGGVAFAPKEPKVRKPRTRKAKDTTPDDGEPIILPGQTVIPVEPTLDPEMVAGDLLTPRDIAEATAEETYPTPVEDDDDDEEEAITTID